jgi:anti-anti-sigma factor
MTIAHAAAWHEALVQALAGGDGDLRLDLASVSDFDSAGVQLLLATRHSLLQRGAALHIVAASTAVGDALATLGLQDLLPGARAVQA